MLHKIKLMRHICKRIILVYYHWGLILVVLAIIPFGNNNNVNCQVDC